MKLLRSKFHLNKHFFYCLIALVFISCTPEPIENHKDCIIYEKQNKTSGMRFSLKYKNKNGKYYFKRVYVLELDWNKYNVGDTIK